MSELPGIDFLHHVATEIAAKPRHSRQGSVEPKVSCVRSRTRGRRAFDRLRSAFGFSTHDQIRRLVPSKTPQNASVKTPLLRASARSTQNPAPKVFFHLHAHPEPSLGPAVIIGTAGHIDHGKTSLVKALTGVDADRLKEEKARGITIDLGFAYQALPDGQVLGFEIGRAHV